MDDCLDRNVPLLSCDKHMGVLSDILNNRLLEFTNSNLMYCGNVIRVPHVPLNYTIDITDQELIERCGHLILPVPVIKTGHIGHDALFSQPLGPEDNIYHLPETEDDKEARETHHDIPDLAAGVYIITDNTDQI